MKSVPCIRHCGLDLDNEDRTVGCQGCPVGSGSEHCAIRLRNSSLGPRTKLNQSTCVFSLLDYLSVVQFIVVPMLLSLFSWL